jgi:predicted nucleotidyltransferase
MSHILTKLRLPPVADAASRLEQCVRVLIDDFGAQEIWVYGSVARGEAGQESDVDLLVVGGEDSPAGNDRHRVARLLARVQGTLPPGLTVVTPTQWAKGRQERSALYPEIAENGVRLYPCNS